MKNNKFISLNNLSYFFNLLNEYIVTKINSNELEIRNLIYPIGSIYMSVNEISPSTLFGGTWEQIQDTFLLASGTTYAAGTTGGEANHTLTISEIPAHSHNMSSSVHNNTNTPNKKPYYGTLTPDESVIFYQNDDNYKTLSAGGGCLITICPHFYRFMYGKEFINDNFDFIR